MIPVSEKRINLKPRYITTSKLFPNRRCFYNGINYSILNVDMDANRVMLVAEGNKFDIQKVSFSEVCPIYFGIHSVESRNERIQAQNTFKYFIDALVNRALLFTIDGVNEKGILSDRSGVTVSGNILYCKVVATVKSRTRTPMNIVCNVQMDEMLNITVTPETPKVTEILVNWVMVGLLLSEYNIVAIPNIQASKITGYTTITGAVCALDK